MQLEYIKPKTTPKGGFWFIRLFAIGKLQTNKQNYEEVAVI